MRSPATDLGPLRYATSDLPERDRPPFWRELFARKVVLYDIDALIAVFDAKYRYNFWRPITAIRNGDIDGNPATDREPTWQPIDNTPMQPEYPCAHCISNGAVAALVEAVLGATDMPEVAMTSLTAPGVRQRWTTLTAFTEEVANARVWAGFHCRFLDPRWDRNGAPDRRIHREERDAADDRDGLRMTSGHQA
jgi:hypothetical protein